MVRFHTLMILSINENYGADVPSCQHIYSQPTPAPLLTGQLAVGAVGIPAPLIPLTHWSGWNLTPVLGSNRGFFVDRDIVTKSTTISRDIVTIATSAGDRHQAHGVRERPKQWHQLCWTLNRRSHGTLVAGIDTMQWATSDSTEYVAADAPPLQLVSWVLTSPPLVWTGTPVATILMQSSGVAPVLPPFV